MRHLPEVTDREHYGRLFKDDSLWIGAIRAIAQRHGLEGEPERGRLGSHIVYRVGDAWIKMMAPLFAQDMPLEVSGLRAVQGNLSIETPRIEGEGEIEGWPYLVLSHIEGRPIREVWGHCTTVQKRALAKTIGQVVREIGLCPADEIIHNRFQWNSFITGQLVKAREQQIKKGLPESWLAHLDEFLKIFEKEEFLSSHPLFLHADLTFDHFLVVGDDKPRLNGLIDMADCQMGHLEYELVAPCTFIFKGDREALTEFLTSASLSAVNLTERFSQKLLAWSILHRYFSLISWFKTEMASVPEGDFKALARAVYPLA
ncbi:MAG: phosphotransferase [Bdellovibrionales bacterium]